ncbi:MAG: PadR family transcriptional regulator [Candidatus Odinarchaeota archaeon]
MSKQKNNTSNRSLNHAEFIVLGLIAEQSSHAYNINKRIEERGMRDWTNIGRSSIYRVIKRLEKKGLTNKWIEEVDSRILKVYNITEKGSEMLKEKVFHTIKNFVGKNDEDYYVAFSMLPLLTQKELFEAISSSLEKIKENKKALEQMLKENSQMPLNVRGLFIHPIKILETDVEFLDLVLEEIKEGKGEVNHKKNYK